MLNAEFGNSRCKGTTKHASSRIVNACYRNLQTMCMVLEAQWLSELSDLHLLPHLPSRRTQGQKEVKKCRDALGPCHTQGNLVRTVFFCRGEVCPQPGCVHLIERRGIGRNRKDSREVFSGALYCCIQSTKATPCTAASLCAVHGFFMNWFISTFTTAIFLQAARWCIAVAV